MNFEQYDLCHEPTIRLGLFVGVSIFCEAKGWPVVSH